MENMVSSYGRIAPIIYGILLFLGIAIPFNPIPDYALVFSASILLPPADSIIATFCAHTLAISVNYIIGQKIGFKAIDIIAKKSEMEMLKQISKKITAKQVFALRWVLPLSAIGVDVVSYASGMAKINFPKYFLASIVPWTIYSLLFFTITGQTRDQSSIYVFIVSGVFVAISIMILKTMSFMFKSYKH